LIAGEDERRAGKPRFKAEEEIAEARADKRHKMDVERA